MPGLTPTFGPRSILCLSRRTVIENWDGHATTNGAELPDDPFGPSESSELTGLALEANGVEWNGSMQEYVFDSFCPNVD
ncbi:MAG: hypothetical protein ACSLFO_01620 [Acidimicrobiales bacterium]